MTLLIVQTRVDELEVGMSLCVLWAPFTPINR